MALTTANFTNAFAPQLAGTIVKRVHASSAFQAVGTQAQTTGNGLVIPTIGKGKASWVGQGEKKLASDAPTGTITINPQVLQRTVIFSEQLLADGTALANYIVEEAAGSLATSFDQTVAGEIVAPAGFATLGAAGAVEVTSYATFRAAISSANGKRNTAIVLNVFLLDELQAIVNGSDAPVLNIVGAADGRSGTINGFPYRVFESDATTPVGFVGPFDEFYWGVVSGSFSVEPLTEAAYDEAGEVVLLKARNLRAVRVEARYGAAVADLSDFRKVENAAEGV